MNLALLDPFRRQIPDRIDSTLTLPRHFHPRRRTKTTAVQSQSGTSSSNSKEKSRRERKRKSSASDHVVIQSDEDTELEDDLEEGDNPNPNLSNDNTTTSSPKVVEVVDLEEEKHIWHSCYALAFNRRGSYLATGHASGAVPIHDFASRTLSCIYQPGKHHNSSSSRNNDDDTDSTNSNQKKKSSSSSKKKNSSAKANTQQHQQQNLFTNGVTSTTWSRKSRTLLIASFGNANIILFDNTNAQGVKDAAAGQNKKETSTTNTTTTSKSNTSPAPTPSIANIPGHDLMLKGPKKINTKEKTKAKNSDKETEASESSSNDDEGDNTKKDGGGDGCISSGIGFLPGHVDMTMERVRSVKKLQLLKPYGADTMKRTTKETEKISGKRKHSHLNSSPSSNIDLNVDSCDENGDVIMDSDKVNQIPSKYTSSSSYIQYQSIMLTLPSAVGGSVEIHPDGDCGLACLDDGSLVLFQFPENGFYKPTQTSSSTATTTPTTNENTTIGNAAGKGSIVYLIPPPSQQQENKEMFIMCASFGKRGDVLYAATKCGLLLGFQISSDLKNALKNPYDFVIPSTPDNTSAITSTTIVTGTEGEEQGTMEHIPVRCGPIEPAFKAKIGGSLKVWQIVSSRNGQMILLNCADNTLRLFHTHEFWQQWRDVCDLKKAQQQQQQQGEKKKRTLSIVIKPKFIFQDLVSKVGWASCAFSGDGEHVVGGCNGETGTGGKYELYLWNTATGTLLDQLTGPQVSLYSLSWHPTRSFIAVGTSDGLVDIWGPRMDWTAFAPDFQALQKNVEYIELEDEFDIVVDGDQDEEVKRKKRSDELEEKEIVDVVTIDKVPAFESDSEDEQSVFYFGAKIDGIKHSERI